MKIAVSSYSFYKMLESQAITQLGVIAKAKELGFDAIEFAEITPHDGTLKQEYAKRLREEAQKYDLPISNLVVGADFLNGSNGCLEDEVTKVKEYVDIASILGVPNMRHDASSGYFGDAGKRNGFYDALPTLIMGCRQVTEYAAEKGITTTVENHGHFCQDSERVEALVTGVAHKNFGLLVDMGNFLCADENPITAVSRVAPYAFYVHAKDFHVKSGMQPSPGKGFSKSRAGNYLRGAIIGHGDVPVKQCLRIIHQRGYNGYVTIEYEGMEDIYTALSIGLENLRRYISEVVSE